ncbi:MAG: FtsW/RodA/SpoVE family cell cycle protein [Clostridiaceae bacterium]|nr:FtsW/RodA/SpoVE family cell cycle protein [Clostridiaceae bacterium]
MNGNNRSQVRTAPPPMDTRTHTGRRPRMNIGILMLIVILICYGLLILFSASMTEGYVSEQNSTYYVAKQAVITMAGVVVMVVLSMLPVRLFDRPWLVVGVYLFITMLLALLHLPLPAITQTINGATRWLKLPGIPAFQPSELAKIGMVFCFAGYTSWMRRAEEQSAAARKRPHRNGFWRAGLVKFCIPACAILLWILLILTQPHLSGAIILACLAGCCFLAAGFSPRVWAAGLIIIVMVLVVISLLVAVFVLPLLPDSYMDQFSYWSRRIDIFTDSEGATDDDRHQSDQARIAIGSGGLTGVGLGQGRQKYNYLPEEFNDYVFAILAEELGWVGSISVILLFLMLMVAGTATAMRTAGPYATILVFGYTSLLCLQAFLNIGVATGVLPPTGISLPLFSYGGTSNLFFLIGAGLLLGASRNQRTRNREGRAAYA